MSKLLKYYTKRRDKLNFPVKFNEPINVGDFIKSTKVIDFRKTCFDQPIDPGVIPFGVTHVYFSDCYKQELKANIFPDSVVEIYLGNNFTGIIDKNTFPDSLVKLTINIYKTINYDHENDLDIFNIDLSALPKTLEELSISARDRICLVGTFPTKLIKLSLWSWKIVAMNSLSATNIKYLKLPGLNDDVILNKDFLPPNLIYLKMPECYGRLEECSFPDSLEILDVSSCEDVFLKDNLIPCSVHTIHLSDRHKLILNSLPDTVETLVFGAIRNDITNIPVFIKKIKIKLKKHAKHIKKINFGCEITTHGDDEVSDEWLC